MKDLGWEATDAQVITRFLCSLATPTFGTYTSLRPLLGEASTTLDQEIVKTQNFLANSAALTVLRGAALTHPPAQEQAHKASEVHPRRGGARPTSRGGRGNPQGHRGRAGPRGRGHWHTGPRGSDASPLCVWCKDHGFVATMRSHSLADCRMLHEYLQSHRSGRGTHARSWIWPSSRWFQPCPTRTIAPLGLRCDTEPGAARLLSSARARRRCSRR